MRIDAMNDHEDVGKIEYVQLLVWVIVLAVPSALLTYIYLEIYQKGIQFYEGLSESLGISPGLFTIVVAALGGLLVGLGLRYLGLHHGKSLQEEMAEGRVPYRGLPGLMIVSLVGLISGASIGPEGPLAHLGAGLGSWLAKRRGYSPDKSRLLSLSGVAATFGGFLGTPMSAAFMSMEFTGLLSTPIYANMIAATLASLIGAWIIFTVTGALPSGTTGFPQEGLIEFSSLLYAVCFGLVGLGWSFLFKVMFASMRQLANTLDRYPLLKPTAGGLVFGLVGAWLPLTLFSGEHELAEVLENGAQIGVLMLIVLAVLKLFTLSVCLATGFPGGFVFPLFFSAGALGYAIHLILPFIPLPVCIVGMLAGIGGAVMRMPFTVILLLVVLGNPALLPVSALAAITSYLAANILDAGSARKAMRQATRKRKEVYV
jgi:H+/Cl- antiporter ClcA